MFKAPNTKPNYFYAIFSVALVLFLLGFFGLLVVQGQQLVKALKEKLEIIVELEAEASPGAVDSLEAYLAASPFCKPNSIQFISKEDGAAMMQEELGDEFMKLEMANPLYDVLTFNVLADYMDADSLAQIRDSLRQLPFVSDVFYTETVTNTIASNLKKVSIWVLGASIFFIIVAVALILTTIRLALYANRFLIKNMELVGASWEFISRPHLLRSLKHGFLSALFAIVLLSLALFFATHNMPELKEQLNLPGIALIFGSLLLLGILISYLSTFYVVKKYLRMRVDDLY